MYFSGVINFTYIYIPRKIKNTIPVPDKNDVMAERLAMGIKARSK
jgi:hypothetical protein